MSAVGEIIGGDLHHALKDSTQGDALRVEVNQIVVGVKGFSALAAQLMEFGQTLLGQRRLGLVRPAAHQCIVGFGSIAACTRLLQSARPVELLGCGFVACLGPEETRLFAIGYL